MFVYHNVCVESWVLWLWSTKNTLVYDFNYFLFSYSVLCWYLTTVVSIVKSDCVVAFLFSLCFNNIHIVYLLSFFDADIFCIKKQNLFLLQIHLLKCVFKYYWNGFHLLSCVCETVTGVCAYLLYICTYRYDNVNVYVCNCFSKFSCLLHCEHFLFNICGNLSFTLALMTCYQIYDSLAYKTSLRKRLSLTAKESLVYEMFHFTWFHSSKMLFPPFKKPPFSAHSTVLCKYISLRCLKFLFLFRDLCKLSE